MVRGGVCRPSGWSQPHIVIHPGHPSTTKVRDRERKRERWGKRGIEEKKESKMRQEKRGGERERGEYRQIA